ncbi:hypothetical protein [Okeania sp. KiyG1]|uniref:hypothetical protein n=1 Tax=Okeania sp. KiyG1 TaxID=2720165 RepID=UPI001922F13A|nr:hypothetical protein [Okeania sp. KiyG1]GGA28297.1 hypothetical protein CYANOKiyG1_44540 [Okeania sp. KiyG1]
MSKSFKILLISIFAGIIFSILSISNNQNAKKISQAIESGVTMTSSISALLISLKDTDE